MLILLSGKHPSVGGDDVVPVGVLWVFGAYIEQVVEFLSFFTKANTHRYLPRYTDYPECPDKLWKICLVECCLGKSSSYILTIQKTSHLPTIFADVSIGVAQCGTPSIYNSIHPFWVVKHWSLQRF